MDCWGCSLRNLRLSADVKPYRSIIEGALTLGPPASPWNLRTWNCAATMAYGRQETIRSRSRTRQSRAAGLGYSSTTTGLGKLPWRRLPAPAVWMLRLAPPVPHQRPQPANSVTNAGIDRAGTRHQPAALSLGELDASDCVSTKISPRAVGQVRPSAGLLPLQM